jgi:hypothetical protein
MQDLDIIDYKYGGFQICCLSDPPQLENRDPAWHAIFEVVESVLRQHKTAGCVRDTTECR